MPRVNDIEAQENWERGEIPTRKKNRRRRSDNSNSTSSSSSSLSPLISTVANTLEQRGPFAPGQTSAFASFSHPSTFRQADHRLRRHFLSSHPTTVNADHTPMEAEHVHARKWENEKALWRAAASKASTGKGGGGSNRGNGWHGKPSPPVQERRIRVEEEALTVCTMSEEVTEGEEAGRHPPWHPSAGSHRPHSHHQTRKTPQRRRSRRFHSHCVKSVLAPSLRGPLLLPMDTTTFPTPHAHDHWTGKPREGGKGGVLTHISFPSSPSTVPQDGGKYHPSHLVPRALQADRKLLPTPTTSAGRSGSAETRPTALHKHPVPPSRHSHSSAVVHRSSSASVVSTVSEKSPFSSPSQKLMRSPSALHKYTPKQDAPVRTEAVVSPPACAPFPIYSASAASSAWSAAPFFFTAAVRSPKKNTLESHLRSAVPTPLLSASYETRSFEGGSRKKYERRKSH